MQEIHGKVMKGAQRGRTLGFPTANIALHTAIPEGIYISRVTVPVIASEAKQSSISNEIAASQAPRNDKKNSPQAQVVAYNALTFIGKAETFNETTYKAESYLFDFSGDLYGKELTVQLLKKIRDNKKFATAEELVKQMNEDLLVAKAFFAL